MVLLTPNANISPLIRLARWSALLIGVGYGWNRHNYLTAKEERIRISQIEIKAAREKHLAAQKAMADRNGMLALAETCGVKVPDDFDQQYPIPS